MNSSSSDCRSLMVSMVNKDQQSYEHAEASSLDAWLSSVRFGMTVRGPPVLTGGCRLAVLCYKHNVLTGEARRSNWSEQQLIGLPVVESEHGK